MFPGVRGGSRLQALGPKFRLRLLVGRDLVPNGVAFVPLGSPSIRGVSFHYDDGVMSFGVGFSSMFPQSRNALGLASACC